MINIRLKCRRFNNCRTIGIAVIILLVGLMINGCGDSFTGSTMSENESSQEALAYLATEISRDKTFEKFKKLTDQHFEHLKKAVQKNPKILEKKNKVPAAKALKILGLYKSFQKDQEKIKRYSKILQDRYKLKSHGQKEIRKVFSLADNIRKKTHLSLKGDGAIPRTKTYNPENEAQQACQDQFEDDISEAHTRYDTSVFLVCPAVSYYSEAVLALPCFGSAVWGAITDVANAIDDHGQCMCETSNDIACPE